LKKLIIIQTSSPDYRTLFFETIQKVLDDNFQLYAGDFYFEESVKSDNKIKRIHIKNLFLFKRKFLFQFGIWHLLFNNGILVLEMNPRILSNWIFLVLRKISNKKTILWGHAWPRQGQSSKSDLIRGMMRCLVSDIVVYTKRQKKELQIKMPNKSIFAAPNAVISKMKMTTSIKENSLNLIYVGRLTENKKILFLINAFHKGIDKYPKETKLIIIGDGEERNKIKSYIVKNKLEGRILLKGHVSDYNLLKEYYFKSFFSVSPGYVGLSIIQSFGFGVPMLVSKNENHSPEIEAVKPNINSLYFGTDDIDDFNKVILNAFENKEYWLQQKQNIVNFCKTEYSVEAMSKVFIDFCI